MAHILFINCKTHSTQIHTHTVHSLTEGGKSDSSFLLFTQPHAWRNKWPSSPTASPRTRHTCQVGVGRVGALYPARLTFSTHTHCSHFSSLTFAKECRKARLSFAPCFNGFLLTSRTTRQSSLLIYIQRCCTKNVWLGSCLCLHAEKNNCALLCNIHTSKWSIFSSGL